MELRGKLITTLNIHQGQTKDGKPWVRQDFVIETFDQYPKKICLQIFGEEKINQLSYYKPGDDIICRINIESREYEGRWYTTVNCWNIQGTGRNNG